MIYYLDNLDECHFDLLDNARKILRTLLSIYVCSREKGQSVRIDARGVGWGKNIGNMRILRKNDRWIEGGAEEKRCPGGEKES